MLRRGIAADPTPTNPHYVSDVKKYGEEKVEIMVKPLHVFNDKLVAEPRLEAFLMPLFDGFGMARLLD